MRDVLISKNKGKQDKKVGYLPSKRGSLQTGIQTVVALKP
jgi:hypothetical protein